MQLGFAGFAIKFGFMDVGVVAEWAVVFAVGPRSQTVEMKNVAAFCYRVYIAVQTNTARIGGVIDDILTIEWVDFGAHDFIRPHCIEAWVIKRIVMG